MKTRIFQLLVEQINTKQHALQIIASSKVEGDEGTNALLRDLSIQIQTLEFVVDLIRKEEGVEK